MAVTNDENAYSVYFMPEICQDRTGPGRDLCEIGMIGLEGSGSYLGGGGLYGSEIKLTSDGSTWTESWGYPYDYQGITGACLILDTVSGAKYVAFRSEQIAGCYAECAVSIDGCYNWTNVAIGTVAGQGINDAALAGANIVAVASGGYIYISEDFAASFATMEAAVETTEDLLAVDFYDEDTGYAVGENNTILKTVEATKGADADWFALTGPTGAATHLNAVAVNDIGYVFVGDNAGVLWVSTDEGETWAQLRNFGAGSIDKIRFDEEGNYIGALIYNNSTPVGALYRSEDGGATWELVPDMPTGNNGLNDLFICDPNYIVVVGDVGDDGTTFIAKTAPA
jgi:photosystem II stability/assembly factor-like uncharacterized protein